MLRPPEVAHEQRWADIGAVVSERFDFCSMSQNVLATNWKGATSEEERQFVKMFFALPGRNGG